mmetsp:Transcript_5204/g.9373  ORF Transcript_5204/g.9373 Transcript_5204/m.9373 type:complete len:393 (+) Transcript_5204:199-1377(+)
MGIKQLMKLLNEEAEGCCRETDRNSYLGRTVALDASMQIYAFLVMIRSSNGGGPATQLTNSEGEVTSHLSGVFYRTINMMSRGLKPVFVFDGKPPDLKLEELKVRRATKDKAAEDAKAAGEKLEDGEKDAIEEINKANKRATHVTKEHNADVQRLLRLMGLPVVLAPGEAEAQCAELCRKGKVFAVGTEDMDALTFASPILLRRLTQPESAKHEKVIEIHLDKVLALLKLSMEEFIDLCILMGCDYCPSVKGIGPKSAFKLITEHRTLEKVLASLDKEKYQVPQMMLDRLDEIRGIFKKPDVIDAEEVDIKFSKCDEQGVIDFLVKEKAFDETRVRSSLTKLASTKAATSQKRMDSFFKPVASADASVGFKRKVDPKAKGKGVKRGRGRGRR